MQRFPASAGYDLVISTQAEFDAWVKTSPRVATVLIRPGNYTCNSTIKISPQTKLISGYGANISVTIIPVDTTSGFTVLFCPAGIKAGSSTAVQDTVIEGLWINAVASQYKLLRYSYSS